MSQNFTAEIACGSHDNRPSADVLALACGYIALAMLPRRGLRLPTSGLLSRVSARDFLRP